MSAERPWMPISQAPRREKLRLELWYPDRGIVTHGELDLDSSARIPRPYWAGEYFLVSGKRWARRYQPTHFRMPAVGP